MNFKGDGLLIGGTFIIERGGKLIYIDRPKSCFDYLSAEDILRILHRNMMFPKYTITFGIGGTSSPLPLHVSSLEEAKDTISTA